MGEYNKDQGQTNQGNQAGQDKPAFGQFDKEPGNQQQGEQGRQDQEELAGAGRDQQQTVQQGDFGGKGGQQEGQDQSRAQQGDNQNEKDQGNDQTR